MSALTGNSVGSSYQGLAKTVDNGALGATEKRITDGLGNESTLSMGTNSASFDGTLDLSAATVTGLPDNDTTYTLGTAQAGTGATINLTGSDLSEDSITLAAGTNITLTEAGDTITIDAAGGGGAAGVTEPARLQYPILSVTPAIAGWNFGWRGFLQYTGSLAGTDSYPAGSNEAYYLPFSMTTGTVIDEMAVQIATAGDAGDTMEFAIFDSTVIGGEIYPAQRLVTLASNVPADVTGNVEITGINYTLPAPTAGCYFIAWSSNGTSFTGPRLRTAQFLPGSMLYGWTGGTSILPYGTLPKGNDRTMPDNKTTGWSTDLASTFPIILFK